MLRIGSLFAGIGGLEGGLEAALDARVEWQVEREEFCKRVLAKHWPDAKRFDDVCTVGAQNLSPVDIICGGFPCQDISYAGKGAGLAGERSGLWREYARIVRELRPRFVVIENVAALRIRGLDVVLGDLAACGYDALWLPLRASDVEAPHRRERLFVVAYASKPPCDAGAHHRSDCCESAREPRGDARSDSRTERNEPMGQPVMGRAAHGFPAGLDRSRWPAGPDESPHDWEATRLARRGVNHGHRLKALGNAVVPQCAYQIGLVVKELLKVTA